MAVLPILKMGDPRLLRVAQRVRDFDTPGLHQLVQDLRDTMTAANGAGLAAPQIGVDQRVVLFGFRHNARYPEAEPVPETLLINPVIEVLDGADLEEGWGEMEGGWDAIGFEAALLEPPEGEERGRLE